MASQEVLTALETLHRELEKLEPAIKHVEMAQEVIQTVKGIPQKHIDLLEEIIKADSAFKNGLQRICENEITEISKESKKLQKTTIEIQQQVKTDLESLAKLKDKIHEFHERIEKISFPERLDKLDSNISGIMAAVQSVQSRLDNIERNIIDRLKALADFEKETRSALNEKVGKTAKKQQTYSYITWMLIVITIIAIFIRKFI